MGNIGISLEQLSNTISLVKKYSDDKFTLENKDTLNRLSVSDNNNLLFDGKYVDGWNLGASVSCKPLAPTT